MNHVIMTLFAIAVVLELLMILYLFKVVAELGIKQDELKMFNDSLWKKVKLLASKTAPGDLDI